MSSVIVFASSRAIVPTDAPVVADIVKTMRDAASSAPNDPRYGNFVGPAPRVTRDAILSQPVRDSLTSLGAMLVPGGQLAVSLWQTGQMLSAWNSHDLPKDDGFYTYVAWLFTWPDSQWSQQNDQAIRQRITSSLNVGLAKLGGIWTPVELRPYDPTLNGSNGWWSSGNAALSPPGQTPPDPKYVNTWPATRDDIDNPTGPNSVPRTVIQQTANAAAQAANAAVQSAIQLSQDLQNRVLAPVTSSLAKGAMIVGGIALVGGILYLSAPYIAKRVASRKRD